MSKGSHRRPREVDQEVFEENWKTIFSKPKCPECGSTDIQTSSGTCPAVFDDVVYFKVCQKCQHQFDHG